MDSGNQLLAVQLALTKPMGAFMTQVYGGKSAAAPGTLRMTGPLLCGVDQKE